MTRSAIQSWQWMITAVLLTLGLTTLPVWALEVPQLKGRVNDYARMLSAHTQRQLEAALADLERTDSTQVVVLTIPSLGGDAMEDFSIRVAEQWGLGQKGNDNGAILLIAKGDRKIRIEVGYGLEGKLTDLMAGRIIRNVITPQFKMGRFDQGVANGVGAIIGVVKGEFKSTGTMPRTRGRRGSASPGLIGLVVLLFFMNVLGRVNRFVGAAGGGLLAPIGGALFFNLGLMGILALIPLGIVGGLLMGVMGPPLTFGHLATHRHRSSYWGGGGFSSGGFGGGGGFGGFSGGGGGFGGGGASGGW